MPTRFALSTAPGRAGIAIVRLSGPGGGEALVALAGQLPPPRHARSPAFAIPTAAKPSMTASRLFPGARSVTGEDVAELQIHGSRAVVAALLEALGRGPVTAGRARRIHAPRFHNGKLDLTAAEGLADLVAAETAAQRRQALRKLERRAGPALEAWRERLLRAHAQDRGGDRFSRRGSCRRGMGEARG